MIVLWLLLLVAVVALTVLFPAVMLTIFLVLALLLLFILLLRATIDVRIGEELAIKVKVLFLSIPLTPKKEKPMKLSDFRIAGFRKRRRKEQRKYLLKKYRAEAAKKRKEALKQKHKDTAAEAPKRSLGESVTHVLDLLKHVILRATKKFGKHFRIDLYYLHVTVGGKEPDQIALNYGKIAQSVSYLIEILDRHMNVHYPGKAEPRIWVGADFLSEKSKLEAHLAFRLSVWQALSIVLAALFGYLKMPKLASKVTKKKDVTDPGTAIADLGGQGNS